jgi:hypothetical protein
MKPGITWEDFQAIHERYPVDEADVRAMLARVPPSWKMGRRDDFDDRAGCYFMRGTLQVIQSLGRYDDGNLWVHVSVCGRTGAGRFYLPTWEEVKRVKNDFIGENAWAYQVFPGSQDYVNDHPYVLHLFARLDGRSALPDFTRGLGTL